MPKALTIAEARFWTEVIGGSPEGASALDVRTMRSLMRALRLLDRVEHEAAKAPLTVKTVGGRKVQHPALRALAGAHRRVEKLRAALRVAPATDTQREARTSAADAAREGMRAYLERTLYEDDPRGLLLGRPDDEAGWSRLVEHNLERARAGALPDYDGPR